ncbi:MAG: hypothetical protein WDW36_003986 [Sanguina aurantia]
MLERLANCGLVKENIASILASGYSWELVRGNTEPLRPASASVLGILQGEFAEMICDTTGRSLLHAMVYAQRHSDSVDFSNMYAVLLYLGGAPVCTALLRVHGSEMAELPLVATPKAIQGLGHCTVLLQLLEGFLAGLGVSALSLPATGSKLSLWTGKFGFTKMGQPALSLAKKVLNIFSFEASTVVSKKLLSQPGCPSQQPARTSLSGVYGVRSLSIASLLPGHPPHSCS